MEVIYLFPAFTPNEKFLESSFHFEMWINYLIGCLKFLPYKNKCGLAFVSSVAVPVPLTALVVDVDHEVFWAIPSRVLVASHISLFPTHTDCAEGLLALPQHLDM